ncbi:MAG: hypothetical protein ACQESK_08365 [Bacteroidota bacterium]
MRLLLPTFLVFWMLTFSVNAQGFSTLKINELELKADKFVGYDKFDNLYYIKNSTLYRKNERKEVEYRDLQLGEITSVDLLNPLKIVIFYRYTNTAVILDNRLNELKRIKFDRLENRTNVEFVTTAGESSLWIFNIDLQQLEIYNHDRERISAKSVPVNDEIVSQKSNFNFCWVQSANKLTQFNLYGSLIREIPFEIEHFDLYKNKILIKTNGIAYYFDADKDKMPLFDFPKIDFQEFYLNNEKLYIYDGKIVHVYQIISNS